MSYKVEVVNLYKRPLDAKKIMDELVKSLEIRPVKVIVDNGRWTVTVFFNEKPGKKTIQQIEKVLRTKEIIEKGGEKE